MLPSLPIPLVGSLILAVLGLSEIARQKRITLFSALVLTCALQSAVIALVQHYGWTELRMLQPMIASVIPPLAWLGLKRSSIHKGPWHTEMRHAAGPFAIALSIAVFPDALDVVIPCLYVFYGALILRPALNGGDALPLLRIESGEQSGQIWTVIACALIASALSDLAILAVQIAGQGQWQALIVSFSSSGLLLLLGALSLTRSLHDTPVEVPNAPEEKRAPSQEDAQIMARLDALMEEGKLYVDPDLTLGRLARRLGIPVKSLSAAINAATGENVSRYINARRIDDACTALRAGQSVTQAMLDAGFNTKSNFNREFLRVTGKTPREWKEKARR